MKKEIQKELEKKAMDKRLSCHSAREIAESLGVPYKEIGAAADDLGIKIINCELGCF